MSRLQVLCLGLLVVLAGCTATPFGGSSEQERPVELVVDNSANVTNTFEVYVVELPASLTVQYRDGTVVDSEIGRGLSNHDTGPRTVTKIDVPESARFGGQYILEPGEENRSTVGNVPREGALVVVVSTGENEIFAWVSADCDDRTLVGLEVSSYPSPPGGVVAAYECG